MDEKTIILIRVEKETSGSKPAVSITEPLNYPTESRFKFLLYFELNTIGKTNKQMLS